jgi:hypothetical protein
MHREWPSANDAYNVEHFGMSKARYDAILRAVNDAYGLQPVSCLTFKEVKGALRDL